MPDSVVLQQVADLIHRLSDPMIGIPVVIAVAVSVLSRASSFGAELYTHVASFDPHPIHPGPQRFP